MKTTMLHGLLVLAIALLCGCEDNEGLDPTGGSTTTDTTTSSTTETSETTSTTDTTTTTTTGPMAGCVDGLDRPTDLLRPPSGKLPCELLPPGF